MTTHAITNERTVADLYALAHQAAETGKPRTALLYRLARDLADLAATDVIAAADRGDGPPPWPDVIEYLDTAGLDCFRLSYSVQHDTTADLTHATH